ncbi:hypothetical protein MNBD_GAMMA14-1915 [hydrothermal vent metagenome]|uniref:Uncharacterized protein n=1 Tax=hydrothermal vent metagenome TaxID=652676 RepID=A0A3B0YSM3_9ZZZZ
MKQGRIFIVVAALSVMQPLLAGVCAVQSGQEGCIKSGNTSYMAGDSIDNCEAAIVSCPVVLCFVNKVGQTLCKQVEKVGQVNLNDLGNKEESRQFLQIVKAIFSSEPQTYYGGKRLKSTERIPGFPYGEMLMPEVAFSISLQDSDAGVLSSFELKDKSGNTLARLTPEGNNKVIRVPSKYLKPGKRYQWSAQAGNKTYTGKFSIASKSDQQEFEQALNDALSQSDASPSTRYMLRAALAKDYGFTFDLRQSVKKAKEVTYGGRK